VICKAHGILTRLVRWASKSPVFLEIADSPSGVLLHIRIDGDALDSNDQAYNQFMSKIGSITGARVSLYFVSNVTTNDQYLVAKQYPQNEYGSHSETHAWLEVVSRAALDLEINGSKRIIEAKLGWKITGFAYPYNGFNKTTTAGAGAYDYVDVGYENNMSCVFPNTIYLQSPPYAQTTGLNTYSVFESSKDDYNLFYEQHLTSPTVLQIWKNHYDLAAKQAQVSESSDIMGQLWHIYVMSAYGISVYSDFLDWVVNHNVRFITAQEMVQGVKELEAVNIEYVKSSNVIKITLNGSLSQGRLLRLFNSTDIIRSVTIDGQPYSNFRDKVVVLPSLAVGKHNIELMVGQVPTANIRGTVKDSTTEIPISGVNVTCNGTSTATTVNGSYSFTVTLGYYTLTFSKSGFVTEIRTQNCTAQGNYFVNVSMTRQTATISGTVTDSQTKSPIEGVNVTCNGKFILTATNGIYSFTVPLGSHTLSFKKSGYVSETRTQDCNEQREYVVDVSLTPLKAKITGIVTDNITGLPIEHANVTADGYKAYTDSNGNYTLTVRLGSYTATFEKDMYYSKTITIDCSLNVTYRVNVSLIPTSPIYVLIIGSTLGGNTSPESGSHNYIEGSIVSVLAYTGEGYRFICWGLDGQNSTDNPIVVLMNTNRTLFAYFERTTLPAITYFSIVSNSTVSEIRFSSRDQLLEFVVSGPTGTIGHTEVLVSKKLCGTSSFSVFIDNVPIASNVSEHETDWWLITFEYSHSVHTIGIKLGEDYTTTTLPRVLIVSILLACLLIALRVIKSPIIRKDGDIGR
jgi:hypothetical protein